MRIAIDGTPLLRQSAGVKNYLYYWAAALMAETPDIHLFPFLSRSVSLLHDASVVGRFGTALRMLLVHSLNVRGNPSTNLLRAGCDLFHISPNLVNPPSTVCLTATIYDMSCWLVPDTHTEANILATKAYADRTLRRADYTIAISEQTRSDAISILGLDPSRVAVVYPGIKHEFFTASPESISLIRERYQLQKPYILYVGTIEPRKNVARLIRSYLALPDRIRRQCELVIAGFLGWKYDAERALLANTPGLRYLGYVPEADIVALTAGAGLFVYPSLYEGFGFPVAQAMAAGVPVVTSRNSSLAEICGDSAILVDCYDEADIAAAMLHLLDHPADAQRLALRGRERAKQYTWEHSAQASLDVFRRAMQAHSSRS
jgi:glycosyltransferase involved in cell wall biosynthesis